MKTETALDELWVAVEAFDSERADLVLASLLRDLPLSAAISTVMLPFLEQVGHRWEDGRLSVAHEHFASNLVRRRLSVLTPTPGLDAATVTGPVVLLACPPGERHDMVLLSFGLMLGERGARVRFLGADTPVASIVQAARTTSADAVVLAATRETAFAAHATSLSRLSVRHPVYVAGRGATVKVALDTQARRLSDNPVRAVAELIGDLTRRVGGSW